MWSRGTMEPWDHGPMVFWEFIGGPMVLWSHGFLSPENHRTMVRPADRPADFFKNLLSYFASSLMILIK